MKMKPRLAFDVAPSQGDNGPSTVQPLNKTTVLGAQQARRRLYAFSSVLKRNAILEKKAVEKEKKLKRGVLCLDLIIINYNFIYDCYVGI